MEDTLREWNYFYLSSFCSVLILVLMEDTLRVKGYVSDADGN